MTGLSDRRQLADAARALPLETVAAALGYRRDPTDPARWKRTGSVISVNGPKFFDHLAGTGGGGSIDLAMHVRGHGFADAVGFLTGSCGRAPASGCPDRCWPGVRDHLVGYRGIDPAVVDACRSCGLIGVDGRGNAVFVCRNGSGHAVGAEIAGTAPGPDGCRFKGMARGSRKSTAGFWLQDGASPPTAAFLVESAIDALSALELMRPRFRQAGVVVASTAGIASRVPPWIEAWQPRRVFCGYDADQTGDRGADKLASGDPRIRRARPEGGKDWNELLRKRRAAAET